MQRRVQGGGPRNAGMQGTRGGGKQEGGAGGGALAAQGAGGGASSTGVQEGREPGGDTGRVRARNAGMQGRGGEGS